MSNYNHSPSNKLSPKQASNAQSNSKLIRLKTNLSFVDLIDWTAIILFVGLCICHCMPAYAESNGMRNASNVTSNAKSNERNGGSNGMSNKNNVTLLNLSNASKVFEHYKKGKNNLTKNETLVSVKAISNQSIAGNETANGTVSFKNHLTNGDVGGYYKALSKFTSVTPQRYSGFFVPKVYIGSQSIKRLSTIQFNNILSQSQDSPILKNLTLTKLNPFHIWRTPPNKRMRISGAVSVKTESNSIYEPFSRFIFQSQNLTGGQI